MRSVVGWVGESAEVACSTLPAMVRRGKLSQRAAEVVVETLATLPVDGEFTSFQGSGGGSKRVQPETYAATVLHLVAHKVPGWKKVAGRRLGWPLGCTAPT